MNMPTIDFFQVEEAVNLALRVVGVVWAATLMTVLLLRATK